MNARTHNRLTAQNRQLNATIECIVSPMSEIAGIRRDVLERARSSRDPHFDGKFFVAVISTGIYCRPIWNANSRLASS